MKRIIISFILITICYNGFGQGEVKTKIDWIPLNKAKQYAKKYNKQILVFFYKKNCEYCDKMKKETLNNIDIVNLVNNNFLPVKIDSRTKDTIIYNGIAYGNQQPASSGRYDWRHDFYFEVAKFSRNGKDNITTPTIVLFNSKFEKIKNLPGFQPKQQLIRNLNPYL
tara:strand:+ start:163 stop:663 length:501 start_codon:yes stop_codon:yes gene_type:complete